MRALQAGRQTGGTWMGPAPFFRPVAALVLALAMVLGMSAVATQSDVVPSGSRDHSPRPEARVEVKAIAPVARFTADMASSDGSSVRRVSVPVVRSTDQMS